MAVDVFTTPHVAFMLNFLHVTIASWLRKNMFLLLEAKGKILQLNSKMVSEIARIACTHREKAACVAKS